MKIDKEKVIIDLNLIPFGGKGWMKSSDMICPECQKSGKIGIIFSGDFGSIHCFKCDYTSNLVKFLKSIGRTDLILYEQEIHLENKLKTIKKEEILIEELPEVSLPKGYKRIDYDEYLEERNFQSYQYDQFEVGETNHFLEKRLRNYLIFVLKQKGKIVGWLARSKYSKEWHKENSERHKEFDDYLKLRYINSTGTDFERILGGFDQITPNTHTILAVEGLFDDTNISNHLKTNESEEVKVVFTFGNKFSASQIELLRTTNVKTVILMYDFGTIKQSKQYSMELSKWFDTYVCDIQDEDIDPGNMKKKYLFETLEDRINATEFYFSKLDAKIKNS